MLPVFKSEDKDFMMMQTKWSGELNPLIRLPIIQGQLLENVELATGQNVINHRLGRKLRGYIIVLKDTNRDIWDSQASNERSNLTLLLESSGACIVSLWVF